MSQINQIQISFNPTEDRLLLRMNTSDSTGFQFWLTRRYVKLLWPILLSMLERNEQVSAQQTEQAKKEVLSFQHQEAARKMDYTQQYKEEPGHQPLGTEPVLLSRISVKNLADGQQMLCIHPEDGQGIELILDQTLLHSICKLLQDTVAKAEWDMDLSQSLTTAATKAMATKAIN